MSELQHDAGRIPAWLRWAVMLPLPVVAFAVFGSPVAEGFTPAWLGTLGAIVLAWLLAATLLWWPLRGMSGRAAPAAALALVALLALAYYTGPAVVMAALALALAGLATGGLLDRGARWSPVEQLLVGMGVLAAVVGWLLPFQIHDARLYYPVLALLLLARRRTLAVQLTAMVGQGRALAQASPGWAAVTVMVLGLAGIGLWLPDLNYDDNAAHRIMVDQLLAGGYYRMDVASQAWALSAWSNNVLHAVAAVLAGGEARAAMGLLWLLLGASGAYRLARVAGAQPGAALAAAAVYASHPLSMHFTTTMQVDAAGAAVLMHLFALLLRARAPLREPVAVGVLLGLLAGLKVSNAVYVLLPLAWLGWRCARAGAWRPLLLAAAVAVVVGGSSYAYAWLITGNPVFPLYNAVFASPYMDAENFSDTRWLSGMDWRALWELTFNTRRYFEAGRPGAAGVATLVLLMGVVASLRGSRNARLAAGWAIVGGVLMFSQIQYLRYVFPALALLSTLGVVGLWRAAPPALRVLALAFVLVVNVLLFPSTSWIANGNPWQRLLAEGVQGRQAVLAMVVPERPLLARMAARDGGCALLLDPGAPVVAGAGGRAFGMAWYDHRLMRAQSWASLDDSGGRWRELLTGIGLPAVIHGRLEDAGLASALDSLGYAQIDREQALVLRAVPGRAPVQSCQLLQRRDQAHRYFHRNDHH